MQRWRELLPDFPIIVPLRHPKRVFLSWQRRGKPTGHCIQEWKNIIEIVDKYNPYYLPVDSQSREFYLEKIQDKFGLGFDVTWEPRGSKTGSIHKNIEDIYIEPVAEAYVNSIQWFIDEHWNKVKTEPKMIEGVIFENISHKFIDAYGYKWAKEGDRQTVKEPNLINKFRLYDTLKPIELTQSTNIEAAKEPEKQPTETTIETLKSQAIALGMKVDGRWKQERLVEEMDKWLTQQHN